MNTDNPKIVEARRLTLEMRRLEKEVMSLNDVRRDLIRSAWRDDSVSQRQIADALGVTNQTIWNEIHKKEDKNESVAQ